LAVEVLCFKCGASLVFPGRVGLREECPKCREDVHVCRNCEFYDVKVYNECREPQAERVAEKDRNNRCDFFRPGKAGGSSQVDKAAAMKAAAEALFKKK
jgi:hypothetical protein